MADNILEFKRPGAEQPPESEEQRTQREAAEFANAKQGETMPEGVKRKWPTEAEKTAPVEAAKPMIGEPKEIEIEAAPKVADATQAFIDRLVAATTLDEKKAIFNELFQATAKGDVPGDEANDLLKRAA